MQTRWRYCSIEMKKRFKRTLTLFFQMKNYRDINTQKMRVDGVKQKVPFYTLDVIISVGYRVKSKRGIEFRYDEFYKEKIRKMNSE